MAFAGLIEKFDDMESRGESMRLRVENEELKSRAKKLQDTVHIQAGSIQVLLSRAN